MDQINTMIDSQINWDLVFNCLNNTNNKKEWIAKEQTIMQKRIELIFSLGLSELKTDYWLFKSFIKNGHIDQTRIQIAFIPFEITCHFKDDVFQMNSNLNNSEWQTMILLATKYNEMEDYEKLKIVSARLKEITIENKQNKN